MTEPLDESVDTPHDETTLIKPLAELALWIAERVKPPGEPIRKTIDKVRKRIAHAVKIGALHPAPKSLTFYVPEVEAWAKNKWPSEFSDVPRVEIIRIVERLAISVSADMRLVPGDLDRCKQELKNAFQKIDEAEDLNKHLMKELKAAREEVDRLRPLAERYENIRRKNRLAASRPRRSPW
ncbi:hypothetical protein [Arenimonas sp.]|uniref:hypothetical protein n=1 Tax=Arenimonas sp. TaxID=1872635 RepID=UPI0039E69EE1